MRHGKKFNHLGRTASHRKAMLANMAISLIEKKRINTTLAKAKALRVYVEPLITKSKDDSTHSRRVVFSYLQNKDAVSELFREVAPKIAERNGGYTRILKTGNRLGDNAEMCFIELVDFNETYIGEKSDKKTTRRSRRGGSKPATAAPAAAATDVVEVEEVVAESTEAVEEVATEEVVAEEAVEVKAEEVVAEPEVEKVEEAAKEEETEVEAKAEENVEAKTEEKTEAKAEEKKEEGKDDSEGEEKKA